MLSERLAQLLDVARAKRDGPAASRAVGRVREPDEPLAGLALEELDDRSEALVAGALLNRQLLEEGRLTPGVAAFAAMSATLAAQMSRVGAGFEPGVLRRPAALRIPRPRRDEPAYLPPMATPEIVLGADYVACFDEMARDLTA